MSTISIDMPCYCFDVIISNLQKKPVPNVPRNIPNENYPLFVTWKKGHEHHLRGCIGTFSADLSLHKGLHDYARISAFEDKRFQPITMNEISHLHCTVSLLIKFEPAQSYTDWAVGVHGIHIYFSQHGRQLSSVFLPEVASEQGWDHQETMDHLLRKGGFKGDISEKDRKAARIERFQSERLTISYQCINAELVSPTEIQR